MPYQSKSIQGVGIGLRAEHYDFILKHQPCVPWFEAVTENYIHQGEKSLYHLERVRQNYPIALHGVSLSIGSSDPLNECYLKRLKRLSRSIEASWISDHLCWASINQRYVPDLLPLPYTEEALSHVVARIQYVQDYLGQRILIENVSSYLSYNYSAMPEWEFIKQICEQADCDLLLDVNNVYVSAKNHHFDPWIYIQALPKNRIREIHLAGFEAHEDYLLDSHSQPVHPQVWSLYRRVMDLLGPIPTLIEWDLHIPSFEILLKEQMKATEYQKKFETHA